MDADKHRVKAIWDAVLLRSRVAPPQSLVAALLTYVEGDGAIVASALLPPTGGSDWRVVCVTERLLIVCTAKDDGDTKKSSSWARRVSSVARIEADTELAPRPYPDFDEGGQTWRASIAVVFEDGERLEFEPTGPREVQEDVERVVIAIRDRM